MFLIQLKKWTEIQKMTFWCFRQLLHHSQRYNLIYLKLNIPDEKFTCAVTLDDFTVFVHQHKIHWDCFSTLKIWNFILVFCWLKSSHCGKIRERLNFNKFLSYSGDWVTINTSLVILEFILWHLRLIKVPINGSTLTIGFIFNEWSLIYYKRA